MSATDLREKKINTAAKVFIAQTVKDVLEDPDFGLELTAGAKRRLKEALGDAKKRTPLSEIRKRYY